jgi:hypothetical protein
MTNSALTETATTSLKKHVSARGIALIDAVLGSAIVALLVGVWHAVNGRGLVPLLLFYVGVGACISLFVALLVHQIGNRVLKGVPASTSIASPIPRAAEPTPSLAPEEKFEVQFLRTVWINKGYDACQATSSLLDEITRKGANDNVYVLLMREVRDTLRSCIDSFAAVVDVETPLTFSDRKKALEKLLSAHARGVTWVNQFLIDNPTFSLTSDYKHEKWREWHAAFARALADEIAPRSSFAGAKLVMNPDSTAFRPA